LNTNPVSECTLIIAAIDSLSVSLVAWFCFDVQEGIHDSAIQAVQKPNITAELAEIAANAAQREMSAPQS
jgi:hypothetical protein